MLLALLFSLLLGAIAAMAGAQSWATTMQREREAQLLFVGQQYQSAIRHYYYATPRGQARVLPARLEDLLLDDRFAHPVQHLRRLYPDPITGKDEWGLVMSGNRIAGIHSLSEAPPLKQANFDAAHEAFEGKSSYKEWVFLFAPARVGRP